MTRAAEAIAERKTTADLVFENLLDKIMSLDVLPGTKMSEAEIADQYGVSRQPVREAFNRLGSMNLLLIQPQRATMVRKFSLSEIEAARFIRLAVELEIVRTAAQRWTPEHTPQFELILEQQEEAVRDNQQAQFHALDLAFHQLIAEASHQHAAFDLLVEHKARIDRICTLSLKQADEMSRLLHDHREIFAALAARDLGRLEAALRLHLSRIEKTIEAVRHSHGSYFDV
ncbi:GntR family transcriptional regulator [Actibacterium sp. 188UL27-1]|uniref:GntR family transcriptional regulator n=1 Tax=Actibacterium sp. 188UL27-1 TaxID=2786961 RepID=UPI00195C48AD|nr:GntR family transcriptional regulator [Actibacterium sp. 188UL27-1]MBM7069800.1 GntR family transcriptional regulator [Actibacterium sp. 188UL27-1]